MRVIERAGCICCWTTSYPKGGQKEIFSKSFSVFDTFKKPALSRLQRRKKKECLFRDPSLYVESWCRITHRAHINFWIFSSSSFDRYCQHHLLKSPPFLISWYHSLMDGLEIHYLMMRLHFFFSPIWKIHLINVIQVCVFLFKRLL